MGTERAMMYYSEREDVEWSRDNTEICEAAWDAVRSLIVSRIADGSFGREYPEKCEDDGIVGTDADVLQSAMMAEIPNLHGGSPRVISGDYELPDVTVPPPYPWQRGPEDMPRTPDILDMIEFCWHHISKPSQGRYHSFPDHYHLRFDVEEGQQKFCEDINRIFHHYSIAYKLTEGGRIKRLVPPVLQKLATAHFHTGDSELDRMLETAYRKFLDSHGETRREALDSLWDAWERLKTLGEGQNKRSQVAALLDATAGSSAPKLREALEKEARELTWIGNNLQIRHSETNQERIAKDEHIDYLFYRLLSLIRLILRFLQN